MLHRLVEITPFGYRHDVLSIFKTDHLKGSEEFFPWVEVFHAIHRAYTHQNRTVRRQPLHTVGMNKISSNRSLNDNRSFQSLSICNRCSRINQSHKNCFLLAMARTNRLANHFSPDLNETGTSAQHTVYTKLTRYTPIEGPCVPPLGPSHVLSNSDTRFRLCRLYLYGHIHDDWSLMCMWTFEASWFQLFTVQPAEYYSGFYGLLRDKHRASEHSFSDSPTSSQGVYHHIHHSPTLTSLLVTYPKFPNHVNHNLYIKRTIYRQPSPALSFGAHLFFLAMIGSNAVDH